MTAKEYSRNPYHYKDTKNKVRVIEMYFFDKNQHINQHNNQAILARILRKLVSEYGS